MAGCQDPRMPGCQDTRMPGCLRCQDDRAAGDQAAKRPDAGVPGCLYNRSVLWDLWHLRPAEPFDTCEACGTWATCGTCAARGSCGTRGTLSNLGG
eukprot:9299798-Pyramimonas_sp.AAC.1